MSASTQSTDGYAEISVAEDRMSVLATFIPPRGEGEPITLDYIEAMLESHGIISGIKWEEIRDRVLEVNTEGKVIHGVLIAEGEPPIDEIPAHLRLRRELTRRLEAPPPPPIDERGAADLRQVGTRVPIVIVHRNDLLARVVEKRKGQPGSDVFGSPVAPTKREVSQISPGKNTRLTDGTLLATRSGRLQLSGGSVWVDEKLEIAGSVDYATGNIEFPGDVTLKGDIKDGFHVWAGGSVNAAGTVDVSQVYCKKTFVTPGGIIGRKERILRAGGQVSALFVEHCRIESKASIFIKEYAYHARLFALDRVVFGEEGKILGGQVVAAHGVSAQELGNDAGVPTEVVLGINFIGHRRLQSARDAFEKVQQELSRLERLREERESAALERRMVHLTELRLEYTRRMENLLEQVDRNEEAELLCRGTAYPGTVIRICRAELLVTEPIVAHRFRLDKLSGRILCEPLGAREV
ncbi:MAG: DUF342 domain-containing protein [Alkalispirochaetaceae bacterium]